MILTKRIKTSSPVANVIEFDNLEQASLLYELVATINW